MKIEILCPKCNLILKDKFECPSCKVGEGEFSLDLECYQCGEYFSVDLNINIKGSE